MSKLYIRTRKVSGAGPLRKEESQEVPLLRQLLEFARSRKYLFEPPIVTLPKSKKREVVAMPGFTLKEFMHLVEVSEARIQEVEDKPNYERLHMDRRSS